MPFSKRRFNKRRFRGKSSRNTETIRKVVPHISTLNRKIKRIQAKEELKFNFVQSNIASVGADGADITLLNGIVQGTDATLRVGNSIHMTSIQFRGLITADGNKTDDTYVRMIVFFDRQPNGADPSTLTAFTTNDTLLYASGTANALTAPYNRYTQRRYKILYDKVHRIHPDLAQRVTTGATDDLTTVTPVSKYVKGKIKLSRETKYDLATGVIGAIVSNSLYVVYYSNDGIESPAVDFTFLAYFKDS